ncbi:hypothetical protein [Planctomycetes bacterium TBK1r]|uniref:Uncharacterized protein n=1 Tax=Stieleria magnilauensis TaxID=2527963 RepID=A0ABX5XRW3_9BACT|nr:hypothetical protein TBK1r_26520 [Planctomycetes bacterium TBK1r]
MSKSKSIAGVKWRQVAGAFAVGSVAFLVVALLRVDWLLAALFGGMTSALIALVFQLFRTRNSVEPGLLETPLYLAHDAELFDRYRKIAQQLLRISGRVDPNFRKCALQSLDESIQQITNIGDGKLIFKDTEAWRIVYERLLRDPSVMNYRSVALVRDPAYWQDGAGMQSMQLNFELISKSILTIERTVIIADNHWPSDSDMPVESLRQWIHEQSVKGIYIRIVRESALESEAELVRDLGIYGMSAVGYQQMNHDNLRTAEFMLDFDFSAVRAAEGCWTKLNVYAVPYEELLDQFRLGE